jgi:carbamoyl-phosphate synthase large subunit
LQIDVLVPGVDEELLHLARARANFGPTSLLLPEADYVAVMLDKLSMVRALDDKGILVPKTVKLDEANADFGFPCISKPRSGRGSRAVRVLETTEDAAALRGTLGLQAGDTILQEKAEGIEYTVQMLANATGKLHAVVPVKVGIKRGITLRAVTDTEPNVTRACLAIHAAMPSSGCYNIQLILTPDGRVIPFEINPRVSTTLCLVVAAGIDPIAIYRDAEARSDLLPFTPQLKLQRHWHNVFSNADTDESR